MIWRSKNKLALQEITEAKGKLEECQKRISALETDKQNLSEENSTLKAQLESYKKKLDDLLAFKDTAIAIFKKVLKNYEPISSNLSCLS